MEERRRRLIEAGMRLFAEKGYHNTSVQEIVTEAAISKGGFYVYFKSKEDFIATSFDYYHLKLSEQVLAVMQEQTDPRVSLAKQLTLVTHYITAHKNIIIMHYREDISIGREMEKIFTQIRLKNFRWMRANIEAIYGEKLTAFLLDATIQMEGLMNGYFEWLVLDQITVDADKLGPFLVARLDDIVTGMLRSEHSSIIVSESITDIAACVMSEEKSTRLTRILADMEDKIATDAVAEQDQARLTTVLAKLRDSLSRGEAEPILIQGLLAHFTGMADFKADCERLADVLAIDLLN